MRWRKELDRLTVRQCFERGVMLGLLSGYALLVLLTLAGV